MPQESNQQKRCRKSQLHSQTQHRSSSFSQPNPKPKPNSSNRHGASAESRSIFCKNLRMKNKKFMFVRIKGLGCKDNPIPAPSAAIVRTPAAGGGGEFRQENQGRRKPKSSASCNRRNPGNVVDVPDVCCTPPGISIASNFAPRSRNTSASASRFDHRKHSREARRNVYTPTAITGSRNNNRSAEEIIQMLMAQQTLAHHSIIGNPDRHLYWRLNVDDMSYEELLDLSDKIGHVGTGLKEEEISTCLQKFKHVTSDSTSWLIAGQRDWKCSICQEKCRRDDEIGRLECGHYHHMQCIKQWLLQKNQCPVCKSAAIPK